MALRVRTLVLLAAATVAGCSATSTVEDGGSNEIVTVDGPLRFTVTDMPFSMGAFSLMPPTASVSPSMVTITSLRPGSECLYAVTGHADVAASAITLHVQFAQRLTSCTDEVRALRYTAEIGSLAPKAYDVTVIHEESGRKGTVLVQRVTVP